MKLDFKKYIISAVLTAFMLAFTAFCVSATDECLHERTIPFKSITPTCTQIGYTQGVYCLDCENFISGHEELAFADHVTEFHKGVEANCTQTGYTDGYYCTVCESYVSGHEEIPVSHNEVILPKEPETCTKNGYTQGVYCTYCETVLSGREVIPAGHKEVFVPQEPATCTGNGYTGGMYCTVCNVFTSGHVEIPFIDHSFTEKIIDERHLLSPATVESPAVYRYDCATCTAISPNLTFTYGSRLTVGSTSRVSAVSNVSAIKLSWERVAGATGYRVYYYKKGQGWTALGETQKCTVTYSGLASGTVFNFAVRAFSVDEGKKVLSHDYTTVQAATKTEAPSKIATKQNTSAIRLMWSKVKNATGYRIYYKSGNKWKLCVSSTVDNYHTFTKLPAGKTYQFAVRSYQIISGGGLVMGEYKTYTASTVPTAVKTTAVSASKGSVVVSWKASSQADGYQLFYKVGSGKYKIYNVYTSPQTLTFKSLKSSATLTFAVRAFKKTSGGYIFSDYVPVSVKIK